MKFSKEELAYEPPADVSDREKFPTIARGSKQWQEFLAFRRGYVRLEADVRDKFANATEVNEVLRKAKHPSKRRAV